MVAILAHSVGIVVLRSMTAFGYLFSVLLNLFVFLSDSYFVIGFFVLLMLCLVGFLHSVLAAFAGRARSAAGFVRGVASTPTQIFVQQVIVVIVNLDETWSEETSVGRNMMDLLVKTAVLLVSCKRRAILLFRLVLVSQGTPTCEQIEEVKWKCNIFINVLSKFLFNKITFGRSLNDEVLGITFEEVKGVFHDGKISI